jgi:hypothetical protein
MGEFQIESEYDLNHNEEAVRCVHCPQHQRHWHGFVLKDADGNRYLLGSKCGPKAYGADYRLAHESRRRAHRRYMAVARWLRICAALPDFIAALDIAESTPALRAIRRARGSIEGQAPKMLAHMRRLRPSGPTQHIGLSAVGRFRDTAAEEQRDAQYQREVVALAHLSNREHRRQVEALKERLTPGEPIYVEEDKELGVLRGSGWLLGASNPTAVVRDSLARLRAYQAMGRTTQDKTVAQLERLAADTERDLDSAAEALRAIREAGEFFEGGNLARLAAWAFHAMADIGEMRAIGTTLEISEHQEPTAVIGIGANWSPPGDEFLQLMHPGGRAA